MEGLTLNLCAGWQRLAYQNGSSEISSPDTVTKHRCLVAKCFSFPVLDVQVNRTEYVIEETAGYVTVCIRISGATLARPVSVTVMTQNGSAVGRLLEYPK